MPTFLEYQGVAGIAWCGVAARVAQECSLRGVLVHCLAHPPHSSDSWTLAQYKSP